MELTFSRSLCRSLIPCEVLHLASTSSAKSIPDSPCASCAHCKPPRSSAKSRIKSIILNASNQPLDSPSPSPSPSKILKIKQEPVDDENEMSHINVPKSLRRIEKSDRETVHARKRSTATKYSFTPPRDSSQLKSKEMLGKTSTVVADYRLSPRGGSHSKRRSRQKSPGRRHTSRRKSKSGDRSTRSRSSDSDRYSRRSSSRDSTPPRRSRSRRSLTHRSESRASRSRSRSRHSRDTRSYGSTTSTSSSDSDRRSNSRYRDPRDAGDSKRNVEYHEANSGSQSKYRSKSPAALCDRKAFNYQNSIMSASQRSNGPAERPPSSMPMKRFAGAPFMGNRGPETSKKYALKPQPIVKLHSEPGTDSDDDGRIEREYEQLLTFETNEDERREQRLLKALSDIAAKAKQKIQSITNESSNLNVPTMINSIHHDNVCPKTPNAKPFRNNIRPTSQDKSNDRRSTSYHNDDYSPKSKHSSRRSRKDDDGSGKSCKSP